MALARGARHDRGVEEELPEAELARLERVARASARGRWRWVGSEMLVAENGRSALGSARNRAFIEALTPDVVIQLVKEIRFLRRLEEIRAEATVPRRIKRNRPAMRR